MRVIGPTMIGEGVTVAGALVLMQHLLGLRILVWQDACVYIISNEIFGNVFV